MSSGHGEKDIQKPIAEYAKYMKTLIPININDSYKMKSKFYVVADEESIRTGIIAFRDFLLLFCDRLVSDGYLFVKPKITDNPTSYQLLHNLNQILIFFGYYGTFNESKSSLLVIEMPSSTSTNSKISVSQIIECLRFLCLCGFVFNGVDLTKKSLCISKEHILDISYPDNPLMLIGLKALSIADMEFRTSRRYSNDDNLFRCDYRLLFEKEPDTGDVLYDILQSFPNEIRDFAIELHKRYTGFGMTCVIFSRGSEHVAYSFIKDSKRISSTQDIYQKRIWEFNLSFKHGLCLLVRAKKTEKYANVINEFPDYLKEKIKAGYGCDRKLRNERCQGGCMGIRIPFDEIILKMKDEIILWLDNEIE